MSAPAMTSPLHDAFDLVALSEQLLPRLDAAVAELAKYSDLSEEKAWLATARQRLAAARGDGTGDLLTRMLRVPELDSMKGEYARVLQGAVVDALEHLHAGIVFAGGQRAPLIEALYYKLKIPVLRRCDREEFERFCADFEKRLTSSYARRMLADETYAPVAPALQGLKKIIAVWRSVFIDAPLAEPEAEKLRVELTTVARRLEVPCRQARLLAQAALAPVKDSEAATLLHKTKRRGRTAAQEAEDDTHPVLENEPPDPKAPTEEELAELAAAQEAT